MAKSFTDGTARIEALLARPGMIEAVTEIRERGDAEDRVYAMNLAMIRQAGKLTQVELASRLDVTQGAVSHLEQRGDTLLSTLQNYLEAAGATNPRIVVTVAGREVEMELSSITARRR